MLSRTFWSEMHLCYIDESGTSAVPGNTSHFVLLGVAIPISHWSQADREISAVAARYGLSGAELHTAWLMRSYSEQRKIPNFDSLDFPARRAMVTRARNANILRLQNVPRARGDRSNKAIQQVRKNYAKTAAYIHLTHGQRVAFISDVADVIGGWQWAKIFAECVDKLHFDPSRTARTIDEQTFEQVVSRFEHYLKFLANRNPDSYGLIVHDNNQTVARKHTLLMRDFHKSGTLWTKIDHIIETPLFVDSALTSMVQVADLCAYAMRRYLENNETDLFQKIFVRADRGPRGNVLGVRHFTGTTCSCEICASHRW